MPKNNKRKLFRELNPERKMCFKNGFKLRQWVGPSDVQMQLILEFGARDPKKHGDLYPSSLSGVNEQHLTCRGSVWLEQAGQICGSRAWRHLKNRQTKNSNQCDKEPEAKCFLPPFSGCNLTRPRCSKTGSIRVSTILFLLYTSPLFTLDVFTCSHLGLVHTFNTNGQKQAQMHKKLAII